MMSESVAAIYTLSHGP